MLVGVAAACGSADKVPAGRAQNLAPIRESKLGLFIHYGPSSLLNAANTDDWLRGIRARGYPELVARDFRPNPATAAQWVAFAREIGAGYIVFTAKHHDGYRLWASDSPRDTAAGARAWGVSPSHDLLAALAAACRRARLPLYVYFSLPDFYSHAYRVLDRAAFQADVERQLAEILTRYGPLAGIWFDGTWDSNVTQSLDISSLIALVHRLQPVAAVANNAQPPGPGEDYSIFEEKLPPNDAPTDLPEQATYPVGGQWFYSTRDAHEKSPAELRRLLAAARAAHVSLLLDVPPRPDGTFDPAVRRRVIAATRSRG